jgi:hypothetical protein
MAVDSVTSGTSTQASAARQAAESQQARQVEEQQRRAAESNKRKEEAPKPVVNAQGQTTGTRINVTA